MYGIGALLALVGILLRFQLPESPRWLISRGRVDEADRIVTSMEERARKRLPDLPAPAAEIPVQAAAARISYAEIFSNRLYLQRTILLVIVWFLGYVTVYAIAQGPVMTGGFSSGKGGSAQTVNHPTVGRGLGAATVERGAPSIEPKSTVRLQVRQSDFTTTTRIVEAVNKKFTAEKPESAKNPA